MGLGTTNGNATGGEVNPYAVHRHHLAFSRHEWSLRPEAKRIRQTPSLIPSLPFAVHNRLHRACPPVPLLGFHALQIVQREFRPTGDTLETMDNLLFAIEASANSPRTHEIERGVAHLAIAAIELQRPFLLEVLHQEGATLLPVEEDLMPEEEILYGITTVPVR
jgi:hypothetical protein